MSARTNSEIYFERLCTERCIPMLRVQEGTSTTPDYEITFDGQRVIAEVKEFERNREELESDRLEEERGYGNVLSCTPGDRVRKKIDAASPQIKSRTKGTLPGLLVLFDRGCVIGHLDPYKVKVAMYGLEQIHFAVPRDPAESPYSMGMSFGPKRKMTENCNTSISAIGVLFATGPNDLQLHVYHNAFAAVPLPPELLAKHPTPPFQLSEAAPGPTSASGKVTLADS